MVRQARIGWTISCVDSKSWDEVDGTLIRFFITDILYWLGMVELASPEEGKEFTAFRILNVENLKPKNEDAKLKISSQGKIIAPRFVPRAVRYRIARFCEWDDEVKQDEYKYHITPHSLTKAKEQGLKVEQLLTLLAKHSDVGIPPVWSKPSNAGKLTEPKRGRRLKLCLKVSRPEVLEELRKSKAADIPWRAAWSNNGNRQKRSHPKGNGCDH